MITSTSAITHAPSVFERVKITVTKHLTLALFFLLPKKLTQVFVSLSIVSLIYNLRNEQLSSSCKSVEHLGKLLRVHIDDSILLLPRQTCQWYWSESVLQESIAEGVSLREVLIDKKLFLRHRGDVISRLTHTLPKMAAVKLGVGKKRNLIQLKHSVTSAMLYA